MLIYDASFGFRVAISSDVFYEGFFAVDETP